ncbi:MAG: restriction endonuclease [Bacteroidales bacterium]
MSDQKVLITKRSGDKVPFEKEKLVASLEQAGAGVEDIRQIAAMVLRRITEGMSTRKVYQMAYAMLRKKSQKAAGKYRLKKAIFELGPTGYPFERFVAELLRYQGYEVEVGKIVQGHCVQHEVDVIACRDNRKYMIECKFHSDPGKKSDVKVSLYIQSRFWDVEKQWKKQPGNANQFHQGWIVTNTRFTDDAMQFGKCAGLHLISWDYPEQGSLKDRIDISGFYPVTVLDSLKKNEKENLLAHDIVICRQLNREALLKAGIPQNRIDKVLKEAAEIIGDPFKRPA